jgi:hypothetical protein
MTLAEIRRQTPLQRALALAPISTIMTPMGLTMVRFKSTAERHHLATVIMNLRQLADTQLPLAGVDSLLAVSDHEKLGGALGAAVASDMAADMAKFAQQMSDCLEQVLGDMEGKRVPAAVDMQVLGAVTNLTDTHAVVEGVAA